MYLCTAAVVLALRGAVEYIHTCRRSLFSVRWLWLWSGCGVIAHTNTNIHTLTITSPPVCLTIRVAPPNADYLVEIHDSSESVLLIVPGITLLFKPVNCVMEFTCFNAVASGQW